MTACRNKLSSSAVHLEYVEDFLFRFVGGVAVDRLLAIYGTSGDLSATEVHPSSIVDWVGE